MRLPMPPARWPLRSGDQPYGACESAAAAASIMRMVCGPALSDAGAPR